MKFATKACNIDHHTLSMLLHYLGKLEVQICCVSKTVPFKLNLSVLYCPLILMLLMFYLLANHKCFHDKLLLAYLGNHLFAMLSQTS